MGDDARVAPPPSPPPIPPLPPLTPVHTAIALYETLMALALASC